MSSANANATNAARSNTELLMHKLGRFYSEKDNMHTLLSFVDAKNAPISLRTIDYFVTKYSHKRNIVVGGSSSALNVYMSYKAQLKAFHKKLFDPFRRHKKIVFFFNDKISVVTTIAQLNFFRWLIQSNIIPYIMTHKDAIMSEMDADSSVMSTATSRDDEDDEDDDEEVEKRPTASKSNRSKKVDVYNGGGGGIRHPSVVTNITLGPRTVSFE